MNMDVHRQGGNRGWCVWEKRGRWAGPRWRRKDKAREAHSPGPPGNCDTGDLAAGPLPAVASLPPCAPR